MPICETCGQELKLDLYTRTYKCENCSNKKFDLLLIYKDKNDLNKETEENQVVLNLVKNLDDLLIAYNVDVECKKVIVFASKASYLYSLRKYWSRHLKDNLIIVGPLKEFDLPLELKNKPLYNFDHNLLEFIKEEEIENIEKTEECDTCKTHNILHVQEEINKYEPLKKDNEVKLLLKNGQFSNANILINNLIKEEPNNSDYYILRLLSIIKVNELEKIHEYVITPLSEFKDFQKAYELTNDKQSLDKILSLQALEARYQKALIDEKTAHISEIKLAINILNKLNGYKNSNELISKYKKVLDNYETAENYIEKRIEIKEGKKPNTSNQTVIIIIAIIFIAIVLMQILSGFGWSFIGVGLIIPIAFVIIALVIRGKIK